MRRTVATKPYSLQGSGSPGSGSGHWARRCNFMDKEIGPRLRDLHPMEERASNACSLKYRFLAPFRLNLIRNLQVDGSGGEAKGEDPGGCSDAEGGVLGGGAQEGGGGHGVSSGSLGRSRWMATVAKAALTLVIECRVSIAPVKRLHIQFEIRAFEVVC